MKFIHRLFRDDINKNLIGAFDLIKLPISLKSGIMGGKGKKNFTETFSKSLEDTNSDEEYKVLINNKRDYNPVIMEGI